MKVLPIMVAATLLLTSFNARTSIDIKEVSAIKIFKTSSASTKEAAYWLGASKLALLKQTSPRQLELVLGSGPDILVDTLQLHENCNVTVEEKINANGEKEFVGLIKVSFGYTEKINDQ